jgi:hypothetical protein
MRRLLTLFSILLLVAAGGLSWSATPQLINYQAKLFDSSGEALPDGNYTISFTIYDVPVDGQAFWTETQTNVTVTDGLFNVVMGSVVPLADSVFNGENRYLEIGVNGQALSPRTQFTSVGYAHRISTVDGASGGELSGSLTLSPADFTVPGNAMTVTDANDNAVLEVTVDPSGFSNLSLYDPADAVKAAANRAVDLSVSSGGGKLSFYDPADAFKAAATVMDLSVGDNGFGKLSFYDPADAFKAANTVMDLSVTDAGLGKLSFYEPADSKVGVGLPKVEVTKDGLIMFGATEADTSLIVESDGDIRGLGQITMGENSSDGYHTSVLGYNNDASGDSSSIGGGSYNVSSGTISVISGGHANQASGPGATIGGGSYNDAGGVFATIAGGTNNNAFGNYSLIPGGEFNSTGGMYAMAAGRRAKAEHDGAFVWADHTDADFVSTGEDQFIIRAGGGVGIGTNSPTGLLDVAGFSGDSSVNLPNDAIASPEIFDEPGLAAERTSAKIVLAQGSMVMQDLAVTTITIPADGYIMVRGGGTLETIGTSGPNQAIIQIDETTGGSPVAPYYTISGSGDHDSPNRTHYFSMTSERIFFKPAGTYEFRLEGKSGTDDATKVNEAGAVTTIVNPHITVMFFPTAYGTVYSESAP